MKQPEPNLATEEHIEAALTDSLDHAKQAYKFNLERLKSRFPFLKFFFPVFVIHTAISLSLTNNPVDIPEGKSCLFSYGPLRAPFLP